MRRPWLHPSVLPLALAVLLAPSVAGAAPSPGYGALLALFQEWRSFQRPRIVDGVPDYGPAAMRAQAEALPGLQRRLEAIDTTGWTVPEQVDLRIVRAEMNGLAFDHRVLRPWAENPAFYLTVIPEQSDQPAPEGPKAAMLVDLWRCTFPVSDAQAAAIRPGLRAIPGLLAQARENLVGNGRDLWLFSGDAIAEQSDALKAFAARLDGPANAPLREDVLRAQRATESYRAWVAERAKTKTGPVGRRRRELRLVPEARAAPALHVARRGGAARAGAGARAGRCSPGGAAQPRAARAHPGHHRRGACPGLRRRGSPLHGVPLGPGRHDDAGLLRRRRCRRRSAHSPRGRATSSWRWTTANPLALRTHGYHWFDLAWMDHRPHPSPIRRGALLYNIFASRTEGHATGWEEQMLQLGLFDARPRTRELVYVLLAQRAARGLASLRMQANEFTLEQAARWAAAETPRGWLRLDDGLVWGEQFLYLQQPNYGTSYVVGKVEMEKLLAAWKARRGADHRLRDFVDALNAAGLVPTSLLQQAKTVVKANRDFSLKLAAGGQRSFHQACATGDAQASRGDSLRRHRV